MVKNQSRVPVPMLLMTGVLLLVALQAIHFAHVTGWTANTALDQPAALVRANLTPLAWCAYLIFLLGLLTHWDSRSWLKRYRHRFFICWLWSVPAWCYFDVMNFYFMRDPATGRRAWEYINLPGDFGDRLAGYLLAFGAIAPGMFLTAEVLQRLGLARWKSKPWAISAQRRKWCVIGIFTMGVILTPVPIFIGTPASNLALWVGTWALLDPINLIFGRPSILRDWSQGRWGRTLALGTGGLLCGFLWEFWNYWAFTKWVYHLPFLGGWEQFKYFEMPVPGLIGFIAFGIETWTMWQTSLLLLSPFVEGEGQTETDQTLRMYACF